MVVPHSWCPRWTRTAPDRQPPHAPHTRPPLRPEDTRNVNVPHAAWTGQGRQRQPRAKRRGARRQRRGKRGRGETRPAACTSKTRPRRDGGGGRPSPVACARGHRLRVARGKGEGRPRGDTARQLRVPSRGTLLGALDGPPREDPISSNSVPPTAVFVAMTGRVHCCAGGHCHAVGHKYNLVTSFYDKVHIFHTFWDRRRGALRGLLLSTATVTPAKRWSLRRRARAAPRGAWRGRGRHQRARPARPPRCPCSCSSPQCPWP